MYYSQHGEDQFIDSFFRQGEHNFVVDVGANDGISWSNTRKFIEEGCSALLIEPMPEYVYRIRHNFSDRPDVQVCWAAVSDNEGVTDFFINRDFENDQLAMRSSLSVEMVPSESVDRIQVPVRRLSSLFDQYRIPERFFLLSIDSEGHDLKVLQSLDFSCWRPELLCVEVGTDLSEIGTHLTEQGYERITILGPNHIFRNSLQV